MTQGAENNNDHLVQSTDPEHPANLIPDLCRKFYNWGWVTGTGGGVSRAVSDNCAVLTNPINRPRSVAATIFSLRRRVSRKS